MRHVSLNIFGDKDRMYIACNDRLLEILSLQLQGKKRLDTADFLRERFAPLLGVQVTLKNDLRLSAEYRDGRALTLNSDAGQLVEAQSKNVTMGVGYKIVGFNTVLKLRGSGRGISNDLTVNAESDIRPIRIRPS